MEIYDPACRMAPMWKHRKLAWLDCRTRFCDGAGAWAAQDPQKKAWEVREWRPSLEVKSSQCRVCDRREDDQTHEDENGRSASHQLQEERLSGTSMTWHLWCTPCTLILMDNLQVLDTSQTLPLVSHQPCQEAPVLPLFVSRDTHFLQFLLSCLWSHN